MYAYGGHSSSFVKFGLVAMYMVQQGIMVSIFLTDPGVAAKHRIEFENPLSEHQAK